MSEEFLQNIKNHGPAGDEWFKRIPEIISSCEEKWNINVHKPFNLTWNYVAPATKADGTQVVIKIGFPQDQEFQSEIAALKLFDGGGIEKLLEVDTENCAILIEQVTPGQPLSEMEDDETATRILAGVMKKLWKPLPENHQFQSTKQWTQSLFDLNTKYPDGNYPHISPELVKKAQRWCEELIYSSDTPMLIHGDLHHDNVLASTRDEWLAIDPKGVAAEPCYEVGAMIRNPYKKMDKHPQMKEIMKRRIEILSEELGFDRERIYKWCFVQTVLSVVWSLEDPHGRWEHSLNTAMILGEITW